MPIADWPVDLPYEPLAEQFQHASHHRPPRVRQPEGGPQLIRVQNQTLIKTMPYALVFNQTQFEAFETFAEETLQQATLPFMMMVPLIGRTYVLRKCYIEGGLWTDQPQGLDTVVFFNLCAYRAA